MPPLFGLMTTKDAARWIGVSPSTLRVWRHRHSSNALPVVPVGRDYFVPTLAVIRLALALERQKGSRP